ncbi:uncharacterized protein GIQ15_03615 [Arthroderma uncinatum]|uniref:uncharacterized protein n=1 Tax=Arthroderma uncinatum TaxID=74035 RepID=UPI00144A5342|nr:uncharacterized protein GIQ15_03615 [Arthroderma uncinatum]KAF3484291.1 hypothetical protein GIQ15_03615 [Arthroderma uncinatum]
MVFIQELHGPKETMAQLKPLEHRNIVRLYCAYWASGSIYLVSEPSVISLRQIMMFRPSWGLEETAALSRGVLDGLMFVHNSLEIAHGSLSTDNIMLTWEGGVKLANIGSSIIDGKGREHSSGDLRSLARIIQNITEPASLLDEEPRLALKHPTGTDLDDFFAQLLTVKHVSDIIEHNFVKQAQGSDGLTRCVWKWWAAMCY